MDILVHASTIPEPSQVMVVGMVADLSVVAANTGGRVEMIMHEKDRLLCTPRDVGALAESLRRLGADQLLRARLGDAAPRRAQNVTAERLAAAVMAVYRRGADGALG